MTEKNNNDKLNNNKDISTLMNLFDDDSSIENIQKQIEKTQEQLINNAIQKIKKITDD
jgi:hypothetical protein